jgi:hypothetical protein
MTFQSDILASWKEIADYLHRGVRTVQRWEASCGLPVRRPSGHLHGSVIALKKDLDDWAAGCRVRTVPDPARPSASASGGSLSAS